MSERGRIYFGNLFGSTAGRGVALSLAFAVTISLAGCGGSDGAKPTLTLSPSATIAASPTFGPPTATPRPIDIGKAVWATAIDAVTHAPVRKVVDFAQTAAVIYVVFPVKSVAPGARITSTWTYNGASLDDLNTTVASSEAIDSGWIEFHLTLERGQKWPAGTYAIAIRSGGKVMASSSVKVKRANG